MKVSSPINYRISYTMSSSNGFGESIDFVDIAYLDMPPSTLMHTYNLASK